MFSQKACCNNGVILWSWYKLVVFNLVYSNLLRVQAISDLLGQNPMKLSTLVVKIFQSTSCSRFVKQLGTSSGNVSLYWLDGHTCCNMLSGLEQHVRFYIRVYATLTFIKKFDLVWLFLFCFGFLLWRTNIFLAKRTATGCHLALISRQF